MGEVAVVTNSGGGSGGVVEENREERDEKTELVPRMVLRVLLVEADDSTRHIISALLRKCSYRVAAVPDGLTAWETLKGRPHNIDLVLTEVELPSISGYALLTLIMEHDVCKNIPVIMMSSQDSISTVFKCMLKGAADFLIKPVRRNELKNLWQHVWRRQALAAGHLPSNSLIELHKVETTSENNSASNHSSDCATSSHKRMECSDERNDGQDVQPKSGTSSDPGNMEKENHKECIKLDRRSAVPEDKDRDWSTRKRPLDVSSSEAHNPAVLQHGEEHAPKLSIQHERTRPENDSRGVDTPQDHNDEHFGSSGRAIDLIGAFDNVPKHTYGHGSIKDSNNNFEFPSQLELSLRKFFPNGSKIQGTEERHALNHSNASAFSRYNSKMLQPLFPTSTGNCLEIKDDPRKYLELSSDQRSQNVNCVPQRHGSDLNGSQENMTKLVIGQSGKTELAYPNPQKVIPVSGMRLDSICSAHGHVFLPSCYAQNGLPTCSPKLGSQREQSPYPAAPSIHSNPETEDSDRNNRQSVETATYSVDQQNNVEHVDELKHESSTGGQSASSSMCNSVADHNNSIAYGSFSCKSDGNATVAPSEGPAVPESTTDGGVLACDVFKGMDSNRSSQREAALTKFRLKRKDRCFEKKVRYQSRKRLAEMRPRVKGQFVRQVQNDASLADTNDRV